MTEEIQTTKDRLLSEIEKSRKEIEKCREKLKQGQPFASVMIAKHQEIIAQRSYALRWNDLITQEEYSELTKFESVE
jgi:hypothetical protein